MELTVISRQQQRLTELPRTRAVIPEGLLFMDPEGFKTHPTFENLLRLEEGLLEKTIADMLANGYSPSKPVTLAVWRGRRDPVIIDGHMRRQAAMNAGITDVPYVVEEFTDETAALHYAISCQTKRRTTTGGALYRLCEQFDRLMACGGDRKSQEQKSKSPHGGLDRRRSPSARVTASLLGCNFRMVERIRKIRRDGGPAIREAVRNDEMTINKAYNLIRDGELGEDKDKSTRKLTRAQIKMLKAIYGEEPIAALEAHGDLRSHLVSALENHMRELRQKWQR